MFLLIKFQPILRFLQSFPNIPFLPQDLGQDTLLYLVAMSPLSPLSCDGFLSLFLSFINLTVLSVGQLFL